jgi:hypothetical protein
MLDDNTYTMDSSSKDLDRMIDWLALVAEKEFEKD